MSEASGKVCIMVKLRLSFPVENSGKSYAKIFDSVCELFKKGLTSFDYRNFTEARRIENDRRQRNHLFWQRYLRHRKSHGGATHVKKK